MSIALESVRRPADHMLHCYAHPHDLVDAILRFADQPDETLIVVATPAHRRALLARWLDVGVDAAQAMAGGSLVMLDAAQQLGRFMVDGTPDGERFDRTVGRMVRDAVGAGRPVRIYGEMVALLWEAGRVQGALALEQMWNELRGSVEFSLLCGYPRELVEGSRHDAGWSEVCALHSVVFDDGRTRGSTGLGPVVTRTFTADVQGPADARSYVVDTLQGMGREALCDDAALIVSELATNAVLHANSSFTVELWMANDRVRLGVRDKGLGTPSFAAEGDMLSSGRGLHIVDALAKEWGTEVQGDSKLVWADLG